MAGPLFRVDPADRFGRHVMGIDLITNWAFGLAVGAASAATIFGAMHAHLPAPPPLKPPSTSSHAPTNLPTPFPEPPPPTTLHTTDDSVHYKFPSSQKNSHVDF
jgi:hypothetical protein